MSSEQLEEYANCAGIGRDVLERRIRELVKQIELDRRDAKVVFDNLTQVQQRCTELLLENRKLREPVAMCTHGISSEIWASYSYTSGFSLCIGNPDGEFEVHKFSSIRFCTNCGRIKRQGLSFRNMKDW